MKQLKWENLEAERLAQWLRNNQYKHTHIANESWLPPKVAMMASMRKKRMWTSPWFPDYCIILKRWALLFIELKRPKKILKSWKLGASPSSVSEEQLEWISQLSRLDNIEAQICYGCTEAINLINLLENK